MTGGSSSTGSLASATRVFNVADESGALRLLQALHQSPLPVDTKNKLRDGIFTYRSQPTETDTASLQALFQEFEVSVVFEPAATADTPAATPASHTDTAVPYGRQRRTPQFQVSSAATQVAPPASKHPTTSSSEHSSTAAEESVSTNKEKTESIPPEVTSTADTHTVAANKTTFAPAAVAQDSAVNNVPIKKIPAEPTATNSTTSTDEALIAEQPTGNDTPKKTPPVEETTTAQSAPTDVATPADEATAATQQSVSKDTPETAAPLEAATTVDTTANDTNAAASVSSASQASPTQSPAARIKDIKHEINLKIGNPISLIDIDDAIGREYMASLLDAMKQITTEPTSAAAERAMSRLEKAFQAAEALLAQKGSTVAQPNSAESESEPEPTLEQSAEVRTPATATETTPVTPPAVNTPASEPVSSMASPSQPATESDTIDNSASNMAVIAEGDSEPTNSAISSATETDNQAFSTSETNTVSSPASEKKISTMMAEQEAKQQAAKPQAVGDPLYQEQVTRGLEQLLSEWSIFKRSGMFGTGPNGKDHPLYETLSQLTMSTVLTGHFEGVTPEVKRSINDYMNGWRYEEGVVHEPGETFEHYLRRVIHHILETRAQAVDA